MSKRQLGIQVFKIFIAAVLLVLAGCRENPLMGKIADLVEAYGNRVVLPTFDAVPGTYYLPPLSVAMSTETEEADIYYTTDGSNPSPDNATLFDPATPLSIMRSRTVKAVAVKKYWADSQMMIGEYTIPFSAEQRKLQAPDHAPDDWFGDAVAASDQYLVVGAYRKQEGADDEAGAAFIFEKTASGWDNGTRVTAGSNASAGDWFGDSVAVSGDYVVVGATIDEIDGPPSIDNAGAAYVFYNHPTTGWDDGFKITAAGGHEDDWYGFSVAISGDYIIVGAYGYELAVPAVEEAAYVYHRINLNSWGDEAKLTAPDGQVESDFALSVGINSEFAVVGAIHGGEGAINSGSAYVFHRTGTNTWNTGFEILPSDGQVDDWFGYFIGLGEDVLVVGAHHEDSGGTDTGSAYVFK